MNRTYFYILTLVSIIFFNHCAQSPPPLPLFEHYSEGRIATDGGLSRGVAWGDVDQDGRPELYVGNSRGQWNLFYQNNTNHDLIKVTTDHRKGFGTSVVHGGASEGVNWVDYDNDYDLDLYVNSRGHEANMLFENDSSKLLRQVTNHALVNDSLSTSMSCWADFDGDGDVDVLLVGTRDNGNLLFENRNGSFHLKHDSTPTEGDGSGRTCACGDADNDGLPEIFVGNARKPNLYYHNQGDWRFKKIEEGDFVDEAGYTYGSSWADYDEDGDLDLFVANFDKENLLLQNDGNGNLSLLTTHPLSTQRGGASKGHAWGDYDNDGDIDLYVGNGTYRPDMQNWLFLNDGHGGFSRYEDSLLKQHADTSAGVAHADFDRDGDLDLFVANWGSNDQVNRLYVNTTSDKNWVSFRLKGIQSNTYGIGSRIVLYYKEGNRRKETSRWMYPVTGYASQNDMELHFGLGNTTLIDSVHVFWTSQTTDRFYQLKVNQHYLATEMADLSIIH